VPVGFPRAVLSFSRILDEAEVVVVANRRGRRLVLGRR